MLKWRVLTACVLAPLVICAVLFLDTPWVAGILAVVISLGAAEWVKIMGVESPLLRGAYLLGLWALLLLGWLAYTQAWPLGPFYLLVGIWWLAALFWLQRYSRGNEAPTPPAQGLSAVVGYLVLAPAWFSLVYLHAMPLGGGPVLMIVLLFAVWGADTGAYFAGRAFGRRKLAPRISPNKTWEGAVGGVVLAVVVALLLQLLFGPGWLPLAVLLPVVAVTVLFSIAGDLFESMVKRQHGVKDSGTILPGHGGVLDRIDSLTAAAPIFVMGLLWWRQITL